MQRSIRLAAILAFFFIGAAASHAAMKTGTFTVGITIGHPGAKPYRGAVSYFVPIYPAGRKRYTCGAAEIGLWRNGFRRIERLDCRGSVYRYGARRHGRAVLIKVSSHSGRILAVGH